MKRWLPVLSLFLAASACDDADSREEYRLDFAAESDPGRALAGVAVRVGGKEVGKTAADGTLGMTVRGKRQSRLSLAATCPAGFEEARLPNAVALRPTRDVKETSAAAIRVSISCRPLERVAVLVVRAQGRANVPILVNGRASGQTDASGIAHLYLRSPPYRSLRVMLDTSKHPNLMPQNPELSFPLADGDEIFVFDQPFTERKPVRPSTGRKKGPPAPPKPPRPVRIG